MSAQFYKMVLLSIVFCVIGALSLPVEAQQADYIYVCVAPVITDSAPYLIQFRDTDLVGVIVPEEAKVTVYSNNQKHVAIGVYSIIHDTKSGGYQRQTKIATAYTQSILPTKERSCKDQFGDFITTDLLSTVPLAVSTDYSIVIEADGDTDIDTAPFWGTFAFHFISDTIDFGKNFQIIQLSDRLPEVSFPFLSQNPSTRFTVIGNKEFSLSRSFKDAPEEFSSLIPSDSLPIFTRVLSGNGFDLLQIMQEGNARIYPIRGLLSDYLAGGFLQFDVASGGILRDPPFIQGETVVPIVGINFRYKVPKSSSEGTLPQAAVVRLDDNQNLWVQVPGGSEVIVIEPWLVEVEQK